ncbi:MAG: M14 family zinc carboxypeptidase [Flavobacteriia bacterium]|jgi:hypothetical protein
MNKLLFAFLFLISFNSFSQNTWRESQYYVVDDTSKYTYSMITDDLMYLYANFTKWVHPVTVGKSEFGLELSTVRIGSEVPKKNSVFLVGNIHAREDYSSKMVMKFLNIFLLNLEKKDFTYPNALKILDSIDIYIMPVANPDGLKIAQEDFEGIQDSFALYRDDILVMETFAEWKANGKGIDLNASFDDGNHHLKRADNHSACHCSEGYKGKCPAEPLETQNLQKFIDQTKPLITVSFHTKGNVLYWADKKTHLQFKNIDTKINKEVSLKSGFTLGTIGKNPKTFSCGLENYVRVKHKRLGTCVELSRGIYGKKQFPDNQFNDEVWNTAWQIPYIYLENAVKYKTEILHF